MTTAAQRRTRRLVILAAARKRVEAGLAIAKRATEKWAFKVLQKAMPDLHKLMRYDESTQFREDPRVGTITAYEPSREKGRSVEWAHVWGLHHDEDGYYVSVRQGTKENVLDIDISEMNPKGVAQKLYEAGGHKIRMGTFASTRVKAAIFKDKKLEQKLDNIADGADSFDVMRDNKLAFYFPEKKDAQTFEKKAGKMPGTTSVKFWPQKNREGMFIVYVEASLKKTVTAALLPKETSALLKALQQRDWGSWNTKIKQNSDGTVQVTVMNPGPHDKKIANQKWGAYEDESGTYVAVDIGHKELDADIRSAGDLPKAIGEIMGNMTFSRASAVASRPGFSKPGRYVSRKAALETAASTRIKAATPIYKGGPNVSYWTGVPKKEIEKLFKKHKVLILDKSPIRFTEGPDEMKYRVAFPNQTVWLFTPASDAALLRQQKAGRHLDPWLLMESVPQAGDKEKMGLIASTRIRADSSGDMVKELASLIKGEKAKIDKNINWEDRKQVVSIFSQLFGWVVQQQHNNEKYVDLKNVTDARLVTIIKKALKTAAPDWLEHFEEHKIDKRKWTASTTAASNSEVVRDLQQMGILPETESPADYPEIGQDPTWESLEVSAAVKKDIIATLITNGKTELANQAEKLLQVVAVSPAFEVEVQALKGKLEGAEKALSDARAALSKIESDPAKYKPQLANLTSDFKTLYQVGRAGMSGVTKLSKAAEGSVTAASNPETVDELKTMGILPETESPADYPEIGQDPTWESLETVPAEVRKDVVATLLRAGKPDLANAAAKILVTALKLSPRDQNVILSFIDHKAQEGRKLSTDGKRLDGNWMGGRGIAEWEGGKIHLNDLGSKAAQTVHRLIKKMAAPNDIAASVRITAGTPAEDAFKHELQPYFKGKLYKAAVANDEEMLDIVHKGKWPEKRMEYGVTRYRSGSQMQEEFMEELLDAYADWSGGLKAQFR